MDLNLIKAELDLTTLIYMIAVVLWVFGNLFSKKNKKRQNPDAPSGERPRRLPESEAEAELREFLERMAGRERDEDEDDEEEDITPQRPAPAYNRVPPRSTPRRMEPQRPSPAPPAPPVFTPAPVPFQPLNETDISRAMEVSAPRQGAGMGAAFASALRSTGSQFKFTEANISVLKEAMRTTGPVPKSPVLSRRELRNKRMLKKALAAQIILGTPRAFETTDVPEAIRH